MANMIGAFFDRTEDSSEIFGRLQIASEGISKNLERLSCGKYSEYMNHYDVIYIDFSVTPENCISYGTYIERILYGLKDRIYAELIYMTSVLLIAKYSDGSEPNMFLEYNMATARRFSGHFGFSNSEVDALYDIYQQTTEIRESPVMTFACGMTDTTLPTGRECIIPVPLSVPFQTTS